MGSGQRSDLFCLGRNDRWMHDSVQLSDARLLRIEGQRGQLAAVERLVCGEHLRPEVRDDLVVDLSRREHHRARHLVGGTGSRPRAAEHPSDGGFAAAKIAGQANAQHRG